MTYYLQEENLLDKTPTPSNCGFLEQAKAKLRQPKGSFRFAQHENTEDKRNAAQLWYENNEDVLNKLYPLLGKHHKTVVTFLYTLTLSSMNLRQSLNPQKPPTPNINARLSDEDYAFEVYAQLYDGNGNLRKPLEHKTFEQLLSVIRAFLADRLGDAQDDVFKHLHTALVAVKRQRKRAELSSLNMHESCLPPKCNSKAESINLRYNMPTQVTANNNNNNNNNSSNDRGIFAALNYRRQPKRRKSTLMREHEMIDRAATQHDENDIDREAKSLHNFLNLNTRDSSMNAVLDSLMHKYREATRRKVCREHGWRKYIRKVMNEIALLYRSAVVQDDRERAAKCFQCT